MFHYVKKHNNYDYDSPIQQIFACILHTHTELRSIKILERTITRGSLGSLQQCDNRHNNRCWCIQNPLLSRDSNTNLGFNKESNTTPTCLFDDRFASNDCLEQNISTLL